MKCAQFLLPVMMMLSPVYAEGIPDEAVSTAFNIAPVHWDKNIAAVDVCGAPVEGETEPASDSSTTVRNFAYNHLGQLVHVIMLRGRVPSVTTASANSVNNSINKRFFNNRFMGDYVLI